MSNPRHKPAVGPTNDAESLRWLKSRHNAPCGDDACDSVYCYLAGRLGELSASRDAIAALQAERDSLWSDLSQTSNELAELRTQLSRCESEREEARKALQESEARNTQMWRWAYGLNVAAAKALLALRNAEQREAGEEKSWPAQQQWHEMVGTSHSVFLREAREAAGVDHAEFLGFVRNERGEGYADIAEEIYERASKGSDTNAG